jgi:hypothetical protein
VVATEREIELLDVLGHEACEGDSEVKAKGDIASTVIGEAVDLLVGLAASLAEEDLRVLEGRGVDRHEAEGPEHPLQDLDEGGPFDLGFGEIVPESLEDPGLYDLGHRCLLLTQGRRDRPFRPLPWQYAQSVPPASRRPAVRHPP